MPGSKMGHLGLRLITPGELLIPSELVFRGHGTVVMDGRVSQIDDNVVRGAATGLAPQRRVCAPIR